MAIQIVKFPQPKVWLELVAGGTLTVGTTYYFIGFFQKYGGYYGQAQSPSSEEYSITPTTGNQSIKATWWQDGGDITAFADAGSGQITVSALAHGRSNGDTVTIKGTTNYDGDYTIANVATNSFEITATWVADDGASKWFAEIGNPTLANGIIFKWDKYSMINAGDGEFYKWNNMNDPANTDGEYDGNYGHRKWSHRYYIDGFSGNNNTWTKEATVYGANNDELYDGLVVDNYRYASRGLANPSIAIRWDRAYYSDNFPTDQGKLLIYCDDTSANTENTLINALKASGYDDMWTYSHDKTNNQSPWTWGGGLQILGKIDAKSGTDTVFEDLNITLLCNTGISTSCGDIEWYGCNILSTAGAINFWQEVWGNFFNTTVSVVGSSMVLTNIGDVSNFTPKTASITFYYYSFDGFNMINSGVGSNYFQWRYPARYSPQKETLSNFYIDRYYIYITPQSSTYEAEVNLEDVEFVDCLNYELYFTGFTVDHNYVHNHKNVIVDRADEKMRIYYKSGSSLSGLVDKHYFRYGIEVIIVDVDGNVIEGATVSLTDEDGTETTDTTDSNGEAEVLGLSYTLEYDSADSDGYGYYTKTSDFKELELKITKSGYKEYKSGGLIVKEGKKWTITLKKTNDIVDEDGNYYIANDDNADLIKEDGKNLIEL